MSIRRHTWAFFFLLILVTACASAGEGDAPSVKILSPVVRKSFVLGETLEVESRVKDNGGGLDRVELLVDGVQVHTAEVPKGEKSYRVVQCWTPAEEGTFSVTVIAYDDAGRASPPADLTISVKPPPTPTLGAEPQDETPATASTPEPAAPASPGSPDCIYNATYIADVTIPDNTRLEPGVEFDKTWRLRNSGSCDWGEGFQLIFVQGEQMDDLDATSAPPTSAGDTAEVTVRLHAPQEPGIYRGRWRMRTPDGREFGDRLFVQIVVQVAP